MTKPVLFVTVDTEEDEGGYECRRPSVTNIARLPSFQELCDRYGVIPTYLANWPVVARESSRSILGELLAHGRCEIGGHVHPWNTPPTEEVPSRRHSMLCNLPEALVYRKLSNLHALMQENLGVEPVSFRAGRWGLGPSVAAGLAKLGFKVDSSVSPYIDWSSESGPDFRSAPTRAYRFDVTNPLAPASDGTMIEVPVSIGYLGGNPAAGERLRRLALRPIPRRLRAVGVLDRLGLSTLRWLSPEVSTGREMITLARSLLKSGFDSLNFTFHSPTLTPGLTPYVQSRGQLDRFLDRIEEFFDVARSAGLQFQALGRAARVLEL